MAAMVDFSVLDGWAQLFSRFSEQQKIAESLRLLDVVEISTLMI